MSSKDWHLAFFFLEAALLFYLTELVLTSLSSESVGLFKATIASALISIGALLLHRGAFNLTMEAVRRMGAIVERNPVSGFLFRKLGFVNSFWASSAAMAAIIGWTVSLVPTVAEIGGCACLFLGLNLIDLGNDYLAISLQDSLLGSPSTGLPLENILPCPRLRPKQLTSENINKIWMKGYISEGHKP